MELSALLGADAERWAGRLSSVDTWQDRFALLDGLLADRMATGPMHSPEVVWAWRAMRRAGGAVRVADLAQGAGCSHRHLVARFREQVGLRPKTAARVLRFNGQRGCWLVETRRHRWQQRAVTPIRRT